MSEPILFSVEDALNLQDLAHQRQVLEAQIASIINPYGVTGPATIIQDSKGRWIGIQAAPEPSPLTLVPDEPAEPSAAVS